MSRTIYLQTQRILFVLFQRPVHPFHAVINECLTLSNKTVKNITWALVSFAS